MIGPRKPRKPSVNNGGRMISPAGLTAAQEHFCLEYMSNGRDKDEAYKVAYRAQGATPATIRTNASRLLRHAKVRARLTNVMRRVERKTEITVAKIQIEFGRIAFADITDVVTWQGGKVEIMDSALLGKDITAAIQEISQATDGRITVKMHGKLRAMDSLAKMMGVDRPPRTELERETTMPAEVLERQKKFISLMNDMMTRRQTPGALTVITQDEGEKG